MNGIEEIIFEIISNSGEARSILMDVIQRAEKGDFEQSEVKINEAEKRLKNAQKAHFKIITSEAKKRQLPISLLLVHAEDQMMAAELIHDLTKTLVQTEKRIAQLEEKLKR